MANEIISNKYDGPHAPAKKQPATSITLDYANSDSAVEIDTGIRETIRGVRMSILAMGLGLAKLKERGLYTDLRFHSMNDYLERLCDDMQIDKTTVYTWLHIGETYSKYKKELEKIRFSDEDGPTKLLFVPRALEYHEKNVVIRNVKEMSYREFKEFSKVEEAATPSSKIKVIGNQIFVGKKLAVTLADDLDPKTRGYLEKITVQAGEALEAGEVLYTIRLYDMDEMRRFTAAASRLIKTMRVEYKGKKKKK
jgi:hypothetical protein